MRRFLFFANEGHIRKRQPEEQTEQALCLNLLTDAVILWNTVRYEIRSAGGRKRPNPSPAGL